MYAKKPANLEATKKYITYIQKMLLSASKRNADISFVTRIKMIKAPLSFWRYLQSENLPVQMGAPDSKSAAIR